MLVRVPHGTALKGGGRLLVGGVRRGDSLILGSNFVNGVGLPSPSAFPPQQEQGRLRRARFLKDPDRSIQHQLPRFSGPARNFGGCRLLQWFDVLKVKQ